MFFDSNSSILYSDTLVPDIFINDYLPSMDGDFLKVYLFTLFLAKHNKFAMPKEISKKIGIDIEKVKDAFTYFGEIGVANKTEKGYSFIDLKEKEIKKVYRMKTTSSPAEVMQNTEKNKKRNATISAINNKFFQGLMTPSWYTDIDAWLDRYRFDEDVVYTLFQHCYDHNGLTKNYMEKVAESWFSRGIKSCIDLDTYYLEYQKLRDLKTKISKKLKLGRMLTDYESEFVEKWVVGYKYNFDIIEIVLKRTTGKSNPNFNYINAVLTDWHGKGLRTVESILEYCKTISAKKEGYNKPLGDKIPQLTNYTQRAYTAEDFEKYYKNYDE